MWGENICCENHKYIKNQIKTSTHSWVFWCSWTIHTFAYMKWEMNMYEHQVKEKKRKNRIKETAIGLKFHCFWCSFHQDIKWMIFNVYISKHNFFFCFFFFIVVVVVVVWTHSVCTCLNSFRFSLPKLSVIYVWLFWYVATH